MAKKAKPCPKCKSVELEVGDCGYNSFNMAWVRCTSCKLSVKVLGDSAVNEWNKWVKDPAGMLAKQIHGKAEDHRRSRKESHIDVSEYAIDLLVDLHNAIKAEEHKQNVIKSIM